MELPLNPRHLSGKRTGSNHLLAREKDSDEIDEFALFIGFPEKLSDTSARVAVKNLKNGKGRKQKDIWGATEWQSITLTLSLLNILLELEFQKSCPILYYRREDATKQVYPAAWLTFSPKNFLSVDLIFAEFKTSKGGLTGVIEMSGDADQAIALITLEGTSRLPND